MKSFTSQIEFGHQKRRLQRSVTNVELAKMDAEFLERRHRKAWREFLRGKEAVGESEGEEEAGEERGREIGSGERKREWKKERERKREWENDHSLAHLTASQTDSATLI